jgi:hypothetical protein
MSIIGSVFLSIVGGIAHLLHPDKPRKYFADVELRTDVPIEEVYACLDAAAAGTPLAGWRDRHSVVDLMKLTHPEDPDKAASMANRKRLAGELGDDDYSGTPEENEWLFDKVIKAIQQRGLPLPKVEA